MLDMFFIGYKIKRWVYWMAKGGTVQDTGRSFVISKLWGAFPIKRKRPDVESIKTALEHLKTVILSVYSTGYAAPGKCKTRGSGDCYKADVPLLPVSIVGGKRF